MRALIALVLTTAACGDPPVVPAESAPPAEKAPAARAEATPAGEPKAPVVTRYAKVLEFNNDSERYTYAKMDACGEVAWVAGPKVDMQVGQVLEIQGGNVVTDFESHALSREFDALLLADAWRYADNPPACPDADAPPPERLRFGTLTRVESPGAYTFMEVETCGEKVWVAGPESKRFSTGDIVGMPEGFAQKDFRVASLDRRFELLYLVDWVKPAKSLPPCP